MNLRIKIISILLSIIILYGCKSSTENEAADPKLTLLSKYSLLIEQPSGITFNQDYTMFWIVGGSTERIYKTDLQGNILDRLNYKGNDIEGIFFDRTDSSLWIVEEESRELVHLDLSGNEINRYKTNITGTINNGLEGLALDSQHNFYVLNEKEPSALHALNKNYNSTTQFGLPFAGDLSDMDYNSQTQNFFITSDESKAIYIWNAKDGLVAQYSLPFTKTEGITINPAKSKIFTVNDSLNTLYEYELK